MRMNSGLALTLADLDQDHVIRVSALRTAGLYTSSHQASMSSNRYHNISIRPASRSVIANEHNVSVNCIPHPPHLGHMWGNRNLLLSILANAPPPGADSLGKLQSKDDFCPHPIYHPNCSLNDNFLPHPILTCKLCHFQ